MHKITDTVRKASLMMWVDEVSEKRGCKQVVCVSSDSD